jgi:hypothetical protein
MVDLSIAMTANSRLIVHYLLDLLPIVGGAFVRNTSAEFCHISGRQIRGIAVIPSTITADHDSLVRSVHHLVLGHGNIFEDCEVVPFCTYHGALVGGLVILQVTGVSSGPVDDSTFICCSRFTG